MIRRKGTPEEESSGDDEEDVFSNLSKKSRGNATTNPQQPSERKDDGTPYQVPPPVPIVPAITSSMKRHHGMMSNSRKVQMDSVLLELEKEKEIVAFPSRSRGFIPEKRGSYVDPGQEHSTTNLFVGNLDPDLTEIAITRYFSQFGDLHSVKIMWPRTAEDRARNRVSGFFCYRFRRDAKDAMDACSDADPFCVGRRLKVRWGKSVLQDQDDGPVISKRQRTEEDSLGRCASHCVPLEEVVSRENKHESRRHGRHLDGSSELEPQDMEEFHTLTRRKLCASRQAICEAMAFCFEHGAASTQITHLLKELMLDSRCSVETRVARLYLLSDILFNSQQPGVKNAFRYRDAIEKMAHDVFYALGQHSGMSRMTKHKMRTAVKTILSAWTNWSVFNHSFLDELETRFEGREIIKIVPIKVEEVVKKLEQHPEDVEEEKDSIVQTARGDWTDVNEEEEAARKRERQDRARANVESSKSEETLQLADGTIGILDEENVDGEPLEEGDLDEEGLRRLYEIHLVTDDDVDKPSEIFREDDGGAREDYDVDGEPITEDEVIDPSTVYV